MALLCAMLGSCLPGHAQSMQDAYKTKTSTGGKCGLIFRNFAYQGGGADWYCVTYDSRKRPEVIYCDFRDPMWIKGCYYEQGYVGIPYMKDGYLVQHEIEGGPPGKYELVEYKCSQSWQNPCTQDNIERTFLGERVGHPETRKYVVQKMRNAERL